MILIFIKLNYFKNKNDMILKNFILFLINSFIKFLTYKTTVPILDLYIFKC
jgi:hypothetical protein